MSLLDPVALSVTTSAVVALAVEVLNDAATAAGRAVWAKLQTILQLGDPTSLDDLAEHVARRLAADPRRAAQVISALREAQEQPAARMVRKIDAEKVALVERSMIGGDLNIQQ